MADSPRRTIVCLSSQSWDDGMWTNKQHIMSRLSKAHDVYYVSFASRPITKMVKDRTPPLEPRIRKHDALTILDFWAPTIVHGLRHGNKARVLAEFDLRVRLVGRFLKKRGIRDAIVWVYHPGYGDVPARLPHRLVAFDCVDEYTAFPEFRGSESWIRSREEALCRKADVVFCTAPSLWESKNHLNPHTHLVHNVGDADHFKKALDPELKVPDDVATLPKPIIGFVGAVSDYKLNVDWMIHLAKAKPEWSIVLIGPTGIADPGTDVSQLQALPNVHLLGHRKYDVLPAYLKGFDVAVIPYRINDYTRGVFPIKFFEFLASGKPVVVSNLPSLEEFYGSVRVARDADEFVTRTAEALADADSRKSERLALADKHTWATRIEKLMGHIEARIAATGG